MCTDILNRDHLTIDLRCRNWVAGRHAVFHRDQSVRVQSYCNSEAGAIDKNFWALNCKSSECWIYAHRMIGVTSRITGSLLRPWLHHVYIKLYSSKTPAVPPGIFKWTPPAQSAHPQATGWSRRHFAIAKDSLYLMTTALKGSALILTWACVLEKIEVPAACLTHFAAMGCWSM